MEDRQSINSRPTTSGTSSFHSYGLRQLGKQILSVQTNIDLGLGRSTSSEDATVL